MNRDQSIDHCLRASWQAVAKMYNEQASKHDSTMAMAFVLLNIDYENGTPSTALGPQMGMEATSLSRILKSMEDKQLIYRKRNPEDGRSVLIKLTSLGKTKREISKQSVIKFNQVIYDNISEDKINNFIEVTKTITKLVNEKSIYNNSESKTI
jgi:MarR family transcriptional regulator, organic hydroperoxide resistance regulator